MGYWVGEMEKSLLELEATMRVQIVADARKFLARVQGLLGMPMRFRVALALALVLTSTDHTTQQLRFSQKFIRDHQVIESLTMVSCYIGGFSRHSLTNISVG